MNRVLGIIGKGALGEQIAHHALCDGHYDSVVYFDDTVNANLEEDENVLGPISKVLECYQANLFNDLIIGIGYNHMLFRKELYDSYVNLIPFAKIIHSSCNIEFKVKVGKGTIIYPGCNIDYRVKIKNNVLVNTGSTLCHDSIIGNHSYIGPSTALAGFVDIGQSCIIGINVTVIDNIKVCSNVQIGGGSVVCKNIVKKGVYVGNPTRFVR